MHDALLMHSENSHASVVQEGIPELEYVAHRLGIQEPPAWSMVIATRPVGSVSQAGPINAAPLCDSTASAQAAPATRQTRIERLNAIGLSIITLRQRLAEAGFKTKSRVTDYKITERFLHLDVSVEDVIAAVDIAKNCNHPYMRQLRANQEDRYNVLFALLQFFNNHGIHRVTRDALILANNDPQRMVFNLIQAKPHT